MQKNPHLLIESMILSAYSFGAKSGYIYLRGEFDYIQRILDRAIGEARAAGLIGKNVAGTGVEFSLSMPAAEVRRRAAGLGLDGAAGLAAEPERP